MCLINVRTLINLNLFNTRETPYVHNCLEAVFDIFNSRTYRVFVMWYTFSMKTADQDFTLNLVYKLPLGTTVRTELCHKDAN